jgi:hypothetical protein
VIFTALVVLTLVASVALGALGGERVERPRVAACVALAMVAAQFALLLSQ